MRLNQCIHLFRQGNVAIPAAKVRIFCCIIVIVSRFFCIGFCQIEKSSRVSRQGMNN